MSVVEFKHGELAGPASVLPPGTWGYLWAHKGEQGKPRTTAVIACPSCGKEGSLRNHEIAADGTVSPSCVCPHPLCAFHQWVKLLDWNQNWVPKDA